MLQEYDNKYTVKDWYDAVNDELHITTESQDTISKMVHQISHEVLKFKEEAVKRRLIELGWTPPDEEDWPV